MLTLALFFASRPEFAQTRIMPLGNSITFGVGSTGNHLSYRKALWNMLSAKFDVDFVGTLQDGDGTFDEDHEGHPGWKASEILQHIDTWLSQTHPDFVLFHIGTNDVSALRPTQDIINDISATLDKIWNHNAAAHVFLCSLVPRTDNLDGATRDLNAAIQTLIDNRKADHAIDFVDQYAAFVAHNGWQNSLMSDEIHPNDTGYQLMAETFFDVVAQFLSPITPVELVSFSARRAENGILLQWKTASETNNLGFFVEHSLDGAPFEDIEFIAGFGTTVQPHEYTFLHRVSTSGRHRYRLRQLDTDGSFTRSQIVEVNLSLPASFKLNAAYPNPVVMQPGGSAQSNISFELSEGQPIEISILDIRGRVVATLASGYKSGGKHVLSWSGHSKTGIPLPGGTYFIRARSGNQIKIQKIQIVR